MMRLFPLLLLLTPVMASADEALPVEFVPVTRTDLIASAALTGTIEPVDSVDLGFPAGGRIVEVLVEAGDRVRAGQALARIDPLQQDQALRVAEASLAAARAAQDQARQAQERAEAMLNRGIGTRAATDAARQALSQATGTVERGETVVEQASRELDDTVLHAPVDAVVTSRSGEPGQIVGPAQPILTLAALSGLEAVFQVGDFPKLSHAMGAEVELRSIDLAADPMVGKVSEIAPLVDPSTGTVTVRVRIIDAPSDTRLLGSAVRGTITYPEDDSIQVPWTALMRQGDTAAVWVVGEDGTVARQPIEIGRFIDGHVIVNSGLEPGQTVVGAGSQLLYAGRKVVKAEVRE